MLYALAPDGTRIRATAGAEGYCPVCETQLMTKCGATNVNHWAHRANASDCDPWHESESEWHLSWKELVRPEACEVALPPHRADIVGNGKTVIELQHSSISADEIAKREAFYGKMVWLFDGRRYDLSIGKHEKGYWTFRWMHPRKSQFDCRKPVFWDLGRWAITNDRCVVVDYGPHQILEVKKIYKQGRVAGWGYLHEKDVFVRRFLSAVLATEPRPGHVTNR